MSDDLTDAGHAAPRMPMGITCAVHRHNTWVPMEVHHVRPIGMGGQNVAANKITVCCNGHYEIHEYIRQLMNHDGAVPGTTSRHFGWEVKAYARRGWAEAGSPTSGGSGE